MTRRIIALAALVLSAGAAHADSPFRGQGGAVWHPADAPLMTRWAKDVSPERARPEYPRPNMVRKEWKSLNGLWQFAFDDANAGAAAHWQTGHALPERILVPWTFEAALSGIGKGKEIHERVWYRRTFDVPRGWKGKRLLLHFGAVDWESKVWVNGKQQGVHRGGYTPFKYDITDALKPSGPQEVVVAVYDPADPKGAGWQPKGKQLGSHSIWYTRTTGIWQTVWLEPWRGSLMARAHVEGSYDASSGNGVLRILPGTVNNDSEAIEVSLSLNGKPVTMARDGSLAYIVRNVKPWSPESPVLYDVTLKLRFQGKLEDEAKTYCAFRTVTLENGRVALNGKPYFLRGVLDQGFWPDGIYTPPTDEAIKNEVVMTKAFGFNLARKHVKVEDPRWYYWCDKLGLLVAQDMPSSHNLGSDAAKRNFEQEWREEIAAVRAHPSVIMWVPFNEDWGHPEAFQDEMVELTHSLDPTRPVIDASGWRQRSKTDVVDIHDYGNDLKKHANPNEALGPNNGGAANAGKTKWIGEYGGVALPIEGHTWITGWGYQTVKTPDELVAKYKFLTDQIDNGLSLSGFVYTQLTDVEQELNGVMTYDRLPKAPPEKFAAVNGK